MKKFSFFLLYYLLYPSGSRRGFEIEIHVKFGELDLLWMIKSNMIFTSNYRGEFGIINFSGKINEKSCIKKAGGE